MHLGLLTPYASTSPLTMCVLLPPKFPVSENLFIQ